MKLKQHQQPYDLHQLAIGHRSGKRQNRSPNKQLPLKYPALRRLCDLEQPGKENKQKNQDFGKSNFTKEANTCRRGTFVPTLPKICLSPKLVGRMFQRLVCESLLDLLN